jgi:hypothetical protein
VAKDLHFRSRIPKKQVHIQNGLKRITEAFFPQSPSVYTKRIKEMAYINPLTPKEL